MTSQRDISWESEHSLLVARLQGFWTEQEVQDYHANVVNILNLYRIGKFDMLVDLGKGMPQAATVSTHLKTNIDQFRQRGLQRIAIISPSALVRQQAGRISPVEAGRGIFADEVAARRWLAAEPSEPVRASATSLQL